MHTIFLCKDRILQIDKSEKELKKESINRQTPIQSFRIGSSPTATGCKRY